jgi:hypothetical protein
LLLLFSITQQSKVWAVREVIISLVSKIIITSGTQQSTLNDQELKDIINAIIESRDRYEQSKSLELVKRYNELLSKLEPLGK